MTQYSSDEQVRDAGIEGEDGLSSTKTVTVYIMLVVAFFAIQFGHGANIGLAISLPGESKAANMALGSFVIMGVCLGIPFVPRACKKFGTFNVVRVCIILDLFSICMMLWPGVTVHQIYAARFLVGFVEAPIMPFIQLWLTQFGKHNWNLWNTCMHAMVPLGSNLGYLSTQELVAKGVNWQWAFGGQVMAVAGAVAVCYLFAGKEYLEVQDPSDSDAKCSSLDEDDADVSLDDDVHLLTDRKKKTSSSEMQFPSAPQWAIYWATNVSLALELGFLNGCRFVIRDYAENKGFGLQLIIVAFSAIALLGPAIGGGVPMSGVLFRPDQWHQHKKTLTFLFFTSSLAGVLAMWLKSCPKHLFWPALFLCFLAAGGVYPAAQGIIQTSLTKARVIEASAWQVLCNNLLFAMPMPFLLGECMDHYGVDTTWYCTIALQVLTAFGFGFSLLCATTKMELVSQNLEMGEPL